MIVLLAIEAETGAVYYWTMERRVAFLKDLRQLSTSGIAADPQLASIYSDLVSAQTRPTIALGQFSVGTIAKFLAGASLGLFMLSTHISTTARGKGTGDPSAGLFVSLFFTVTLGLLGPLITDFGSAWVNVAGYFIFFAVLIAVLGLTSPARPH